MAASEIAGVTRAAIHVEEAEHFWKAFNSYRAIVGNARVPMSMMTLELYCRGLMSGHKSTFSRELENVDGVIPMEGAVELTGRNERTLRRWVAAGRLSWTEEDGVRGFRRGDLSKAREAMKR